MCRLGWGGRESLQPLERDSLVLLWRQDMTRLPKTPGETPALIPARAAPGGEEMRNPLGELSIPLPGETEPLAWGRAQPGGHNGLIYLFI